MRASSPSTTVQTRSLLATSNDIEIVSDSDDDGVENNTVLRNSTAESPPTRTAVDARDAKTLKSSVLNPTVSTHSKTRSKASPNVASKERHPHMIAADEERLARALASDAAVKAGVRMYHQAVFQQQKKRRLTGVTSGSPKRDVECTFKPVLSSGTADLLKVAGTYRSPAERFDAQEIRLAKARLIQQHAASKIEMDSCTFRPQIEAVSEALVRRSRSAPRDRQVLPPASTRLYEDGVEKLRRQQLLAAHVRDQEDKERVGGVLRLSADSANAVSRRLTGWKRNVENNLEVMRREWMLMLRPRRSRSSDDKTFFEHLYHPEHSGQSAPRHREESAAAVAAATPAPLASERSKAMARELQTIRFRALYTKYLGPRQETLRLADIREQITKLFPHDAGVLQALAHFQDTDAVAVDAFVAALVAFERKCGPQPWGRLEHRHLMEDSDESSDEKSVRRKRALGIPKISAASEHMASAMQSRSAQPIYEYLIKRGQDAQRHRDAQAMEVLASKGVDCTFRPKINPQPTSRRRNLGEAQSREAKSERRDRRNSTPNRREPVLCAFSCPPSPGSLNRSGGQGSNHRSDEIDELMNHIEAELQATNVTTSSSGRHGSAPDRFASPQRPAAPLTPTAHAAVAQMRSNPLCGTPVAHRSPFETVDWNASRSHRSSLQGSGDKRSIGHLTNSPRAVARFASHADSMLDNIYCKVSVERRYSQTMAHRHSRSPKRSKGAAAAQAPASSVGGSKPFR